MDYLSRASSPISAELWKKIDDAVVSTAKKFLTGRRFISIYGPLGAGVQSVFKTPVLKGEQAVLVCPEPQNMDLVLGQDMITAYLGSET